MNEDCRKQLRKVILDFIYSDKSEWTDEEVSNALCNSITIMGHNVGMTDKESMARHARPNLELLEVEPIDGGQYTIAMRWKEWDWSDHCMHTVGVECADGHPFHLIGIEH